MQGPGRGEGKCQSWKPHATGAGWGLVLRPPMSAEDP